MADNSSDGEHSSEAHEAVTSSPEPAQTPATDANTASSSGAKGETKEDLLSAVLKALPDDDPAKVEAGKEKTSEGEEPPASEADTNKGNEADPGENEEPNDDPSREEMENYSAKVKKRINQLLGQRNTLNQQVQALQSEASISRSLRTYLETHDIAKEDFQLTLDLAAAMRRGDFRGFLEGVGPYVNLAQQALGMTLPPDLEQMVQQGQVTTGAAAQMSRDRYGRAMAEQNAQRATQMAQTADNQHRVRATQQAITQSVEHWEAQIRQSDPDYARKEATVKNLVWSVVQERGVPQSPQQALEVAQEAYRRTNETMRSFAPAPKPTARVPSSVNRSAPGSRAEPKSLMEAALLGLERARRAG